MWPLLMGLVLTALGDEAFTETSPHVSHLSEEGLAAAFTPSSPPHLIMFYAPWCGHCRHAKGPFESAATTAFATHPDPTIRGKSAKFAMVDATAFKSAAQTFGVHGYPTFMYTIGGRAYRYEGGRGAENLLYFALLLHHMHSGRPLADTITSPEHFAALVEASKRVPVVLCADDSLPHPPSWDAAIAGLASVPMVHFMVLPRKGLEGTPAGHPLQRVRERCEVALTVERTTAVVVASDAYDDPPVYRGPLSCDIAGSKDCVFSVTTLGIEPQAPMRAVAEFISHHAIPAVTHLTPDAYTILGMRPLLGLAVIEQGTKIDVESVRRALRNASRMIHRGDYNPKRRVAFVTVDGTEQATWLESFAVGSARPQFVVINLQGQIVYRLSDVKDQHGEPMYPGEDLLTAPVWGGRQVEAIAALSQAASWGLASGTHVGPLSFIVAPLLSLPGMGVVHSYIQDDVQLLLLCAIVVVCVPLAVMMVRDLKVKPAKPVKQKQS